jgi:hypothetical protein
MIRWVARHTGVLQTLYLRVRVAGSVNCRYDNRPGYAGGTTGQLLATLHPVLPDGSPDLSRELAREQFQPCGREKGESIDLHPGVSVTAGVQYATVVRNVDQAPDVNYFSINFLRSATGLWGANGRNERSANATDLFYGLDPRELVGTSRDSGHTWTLPGPGPWVPTYIQSYSDGYRGGQPYYYSHPASGPVTMIYKGFPVPWTISALGAYASGPGHARVVLKVDDVERGSADLSGTGMLRQRIAPVIVQPGQVVKVSTTAGSGGLALRQESADATWASVLGLGTNYFWYQENDPEHAVPIYPLPGFGAQPSPAPPGRPPPPGGNPIPPLPLSG